MTRTRAKEGVGLFQLGCVLAVIVAFSIPALQIHLWGDDFEHFQAAYQLYESPGRAFQPSYLFFRPLMLASMYISYRCFGTNSSLYDVVTLAHHLLVVALLFLLLRTAGCRRRVSVAASLLFGSTALAAEATLWTVARADVLVAACTLCLLLCLATFEDSLRALPQSLMLLVYAAAMCSKESWVVLPAIAVLYLLLTRREAVARAVLATLGGWILLVLYVGRLFVMPAVLGHRSAFDYSGGVSSVPAMITKFGSLIWYYCSLGQAPGSGVVHVACGYLIFAVLATVAVLQRNRLALFGGGLMVLALVPTIHLPVAPSRFNYLPLIGYWIAIVAMVEHVLERQVLPAPLSRRVLGLCASAALVGVVVFQITQVQREILDYDRFGERHGMLVSAWLQVPERVREASTLIVVDMGTLDGPKEFANNVQGLPKYIYPKPEGLWHLISFAALANFAGRPFERRIEEVRAADVEESMIGSAAVVVFGDTGFRVCARCDADILAAFRQSGHLPARTRLFRLQEVTP